MSVELAGVRTNFRMPDVLTIALGGGSVIRQEPFSIGPDSVGYRLTEEALVFGGATLTATDAAVAGGLAQVGNPGLIKGLAPSTVSRVLAEIQRRVEESVDRVKISTAPVPVILVGGGAILVGDSLKEDLPDSEALPVLPISLRSGRRIDSLYLAVSAANAALANGGSAGSGGEGEAKQALQRAVDELMGEGGLTRQLYGKRGWFAAAMSGKAVDYSARTVIAPGYDLSYDECGLPRSMAKTLFEPLVLGELTRAGDAASVDEARHMLSDDHPRALKTLERVARERLVLLHRAPVLHRWGIQAFRPVLTDEDVLRLHPLTTETFNADFDGDEMDVFLPLSASAQEEARSMLPSKNQVGLATGQYVNRPSQGIVFGCYYATVKNSRTAARPFESLDAVAVAFERGELGVHETVSVPGDGERRQTTAGRALFNRLLPDQLGWVDGPVGKRELTALLLRCWRELGEAAAARLGDAIMRFGFRQATLSGLSIGVDVLRQYSRFDSRLAEAWGRAQELENQSRQDRSSDPPSDGSVVDHWLEVAGDFEREAMAELAEDRDGLNPLHLMVISGARGNSNQVKQLIAMRGLFASPDGKIIEAPFATTFVRGQSPLEFFASTYGARKGLADTCLKTANAGFLFKRVMSAVHDILVTEEDCGSGDGIAKSAMRGWHGENVVVSLGERVRGRTATEDIRLSDASSAIVRRGELIGSEAAEEIEASDLGVVSVRSPLTCKALAGVCGKCYGADLSRWRPARPGLPVGVIAAHSIGEPMTQLTLRTFAFRTPARLWPSGRDAEPPVVAGLPHLDELFEAGRSPVGDRADARAAFEERLLRDGAAATAEQMLVEMARIYRLQGVLVDDRHFEVIIRQMLDKLRVTAAGDTGLQVGELVSAPQLEAANADVGGGESAAAEPTVVGVTEAASATGDFVAAGTTHGGVPALARAAARKQRVELDGVRSCTTFGKVVPARA